MRKVTIAGVAFAVLLALLALAVGYRALRQTVRSAAETSPASTPTLETTETHPATEDHRGFLYGRITTVDGATHEGRLRFGGAEEASWGDYFNGFRDENPWAAQVPPERLPKDRHPVGLFGVTFFTRESELDLGRPFMMRFGDIARIEARGRDIRVTLKSGSVVELDRFAADDLADGVRVWDGAGGVLDFDERRIRTIEFLPTPALGDAPYRLHGTVSTPQGDFTGFIQWNRERGLGSDTLTGRTAESWLSVRFDAIRSIVRRSTDGSRVTLLDGREIVLTDTRDVGEGNRGMYVDDPRYGRVLISWDAFERLELSPGGGGPVYDDFPPGHPLTGTVTTRAGTRLTGRLVFDLDESETTATLDAPYQGVDYTIPFGLIASIVPPGRVTLHGGEVLELEPAGDFGELNAGMLVFVEGRERPDYVPWSDVVRVDFDRPPAMYPAPGERSVGPPGPEPGTGGS